MSTSDAWRKLGEEIRARRLANGWTLRQLSQELENQGLPTGSSVSHLSELERGVGRASPELIRALDDLFKAHRRLVRLLKDAKVPEGAAPGRDVCVAAHLFYPAFLSEAPDDQGTVPAGPGWFVQDVSRYTCSENHFVYVFPFNVAVVHEVHDLQRPNLTDIAIWRSEQIIRAHGCAQQWFEQLGWPVSVLDEDPYCLSCFELKSGPWGEHELYDRAVQILSMPSVLSRPAADDYDLAVETERSLLSSSEPIRDLRPFGIAGSHSGWASWAAVAFWDVSAHCDIRDELLHLEVQLQALWCYACNVERRRAPVSPQYGVLFLRNYLRHLQRPRPTEHTSVRMLREELVRTSRILETVSGAVEAVTS